MCKQGAKLGVRVGGNWGKRVLWYVCIVVMLKLLRCRELGL